MGDLVDRIFGGTDTSAQDNQIAANAAAQRFIEQQAGQARQDVIGLSAGSEGNRDLATQAALNIFGQTIPQQINAFQGGNFGAQQAILGGLPQIQNALLGLPVDFNALQPTMLDVDTSFAQQQLPEFLRSGALLGGLTGTASPSAGSIGGSGRVGNPRRHIPFNTGI